MQLVFRDISAEPDQVRSMPLARIVLPEVAR
jgi:hypothetical protein